MNTYTKFASEAYKILHLGIQFDPDVDSVYATEHISINTWRSTWGYNYNTGTTGLLAVASMKVKNSMRGIFSRGNYFDNGDTMLSSYDIREHLEKVFSTEDDYWIIRYIETGDIYKLNSVPYGKQNPNKRKWASIEPMEAAEKILLAMIIYGEEWYKNVKG